MNKIIIIGMLACLCFETINGVPLERKKREAEPETTILNRIDGDSSEPKIVDIESLFNQNNEFTDNAYDVMATESSDASQRSPIEEKISESEPETTILNRIDGDSPEPKIVDIESLFNQNNEYDAYDVMATESSDGNEASENSDGNEASENPDGNAASENSDDN